VRKTHIGPMIRYQSLSMPVMVLSQINEEEKINVECDDEKKGNSNNTGFDSSQKEKRYISFI